ncbi:MAG: hypothetical protein HY558_03255 [Euryarchaeota archaeon]|nr:hypothetical protein [Euryarchaeota archaeon]
MSEGFLYRGIALAFGLAAIASLVLFLSQFRKSKELIKARLFLMYDRLSRMLILFLLVGVAGIGVHVAYITSGADDNFIVPEKFFRSGIYALGVYLAAIGMGLVMYFILRPVDRPRPEERQPPTGPGSPRT